MNNKIKVLAIVIILSLIAIGVFAYVQSHANFGSSEIQIPEGYKVESKSTHTIKLVGNNSTIIVDEKKESIDKIFKKYKKKNKNANITESSMQLKNNITLKNITNGTNNLTNYYYEKNNKVYQIYLIGNINNQTLEQVVLSTENKKLPW